MRPELSSIVNRLNLSYDMAMAEAEAEHYRRVEKILEAASEIISYNGEVLEISKVNVRPLFNLLIMPKHIYSFIEMT